ncbi:hypothetical protein PT974_09658 [Cladobotryum mycophilum]|uniref:BZIP domain-containing protein n=1 Tax=Cladobotryum mycophilum TaxID=491253 RepID=A0ABR0SGT3_9HYPO
MPPLPQLFTKMTGEHNSVENEDPRETISPSASPTSQRTLFTDSHDSKSTASSSRGSSPSLKTSHHTTKQARPRSSSWFGSTFSNHIFSPRPYEQIYAESAYLNRSLQIEGANTAELFNRYSLVQEALQGDAAVGKHRRKLRKQLSLLKSKISQASQQEKSIIVRLSELQVEYQSRDAWYQVQRRRMSSQSTTHSQCMKRPATSPGCTTSPRTPLNAESLEFVPCGNASFSQGSSRFPDPQPEPTSGSSTLNTVDEKDESSIDERQESDSETQSGRHINDLHNHGLEYTYETSNEEKVSQSLNSKSECITEQITTNEKRLSLPSLHFVWP